MGPTVPERGAALFHKPGKRVGRWMSGFPGCALMPSFMVLCREALVLRGELALEKRGTQLSPRGGLIMLSSGRVSGLENVPPREGTMRGLKFQMPSAALRQGLRTKP